MITPLKQLLRMYTNMI